MTEPRPRGTIDIMHEKFCREALRRTDNHNGKAALLLGVSERTVLRMKKTYGIKKENPKTP
jgi:transcriptional regulator with PAS, ATPase and Fis domain